MRKKIAFSDNSNIRFSVVWKVFYTFLYHKISVILVLSFIYLLISYSYAAELFKSGEKFTYEVKSKGFKTGTSQLTFQGKEKINGRECYHITFFTRLTAFTDVEEIYGSKDTFLPVEVRRTIKRFGTFATKIIEKYDQEKFRVDVQKKSRFHTEEFSIQKDAPLNNAILLSYYCRAKKDFNQNERYKIILPTIEFDVMFSGKEVIETALGEFEAYVFTSDPPKFKLWLSTDEKRIPLKIINPGKLEYSLEIKSID